MSFSHRLEQIGREEQKYNDAKNEVDWVQANDISSPESNSVLLKMKAHFIKIFDIFNCNSRLRIALLFSKFDVISEELNLHNKLNIVGIEIFGAGLRIRYCMRSWSWENVARSRHLNKNS